MAPPYSAPPPLVESSPALSLACLQGYYGQMGGPGMQLAPFSYGHPYQGMMQVGLPQAPPAGAGAPQLVQGALAFAGKLFFLKSQHDIIVKSGGKMGHSLLSAAHGMVADWQRLPWLPCWPSSSRQPPNNCAHPRNMCFPYRPSAASRWPGASPCEAQPTSTPTSQPPPARLHAAHQCADPAAAAGVCHGGVPGDLPWC